MDVIWKSALEQAQLIRHRDISARELLSHHLQRIDAINSTINAIVQLDADRALNAADEVDRRLAAGEPARPFAGVPFTAKDNLETSGIITAIGVPERRETTPTQDATVVQRMNAAGAILLGKTNCPPWGGGLETENPLYGRTVNPYDSARTPGGSSGGEAAAIASGMSPFGLGSDSGGSLRYPAHFCGIATIKPTAGLIPLTGALDDVGQFGALRDPRTQIGPMARSVTDLMAMLDVLRGPDGIDPSVMRVDDEDDQNLQLRVAVQYTNGEVLPDPDTENTVSAAAETLRKAEMAVETAELPDEGLALTREVWRSYGGEMSSRELYNVLAEWDAFRSRMLIWFHQFDLILRPVSAQPASRHGETDPATLYTVPFSLTGWPAAVVRYGTSAEGLPIGVQIVAHPWKDRLALRAASLLERPDFYSNLFKSR
jgi:amidase